MLGNSDTWREAVFHLCVKCWLFAQIPIVIAVKMLQFKGAANFYCQQYKTQLCKYMDKVVLTWPFTDYFSTHVPQGKS